MYRHNIIQNSLYRGNTCVNSPQKFTVCQHACKLLLRRLHAPTCISNTSLQALVFREKTFVLPFNLME